MDCLAVMRELNYNKQPRTPEFNKLFNCYQPPLATPQDTIDESMPKKIDLGNGLIPFSPSVELYSNSKYLKDFQKIKTFADSGKLCDTQPCFGIENNLIVRRNYGVITFKIKQNEYHIYVGVLYNEIDL